MLPVCRIHASPSKDQNPYFTPSSPPSSQLLTIIHMPKEQTGFSASSIKSVPCLSQHGERSLFFEKPSCLNPLKAASWHCMMLEKMGSKGVWNIFFLSPQKSF
jgi:hypothetical protein